MLNQITQIRLPDGQVVALVDWTDKPLFGTCDLGSGYTNEIVDLFQVSVGRPVPSAAAGPNPVVPRQNTLADTNISTQGGLSSTEEFLIYSMKPEVQEYVFEPNDFTTRTSVGQTPTGVATADPYMPQPSLSCLAQLNAALLLEIEISLKIYSQAGFGWYNLGFGAQAQFQNGAGGGAQGVTPANQGMPAQDAVRTLVVPMHIGGQENFRVRLRNPTAQPVAFGATTGPVGGGDTADDPNHMVSIRVYLDGLYKRPVS